MNEFLKSKAASKKPKILQKSIDDYYFARINEKAESVEKNDDAHKGQTYTTATEMEKARREVACLENKLVIARRERNNDRIEKEERFKASADLFNALYENIPKLNGYYKDSFAKRERSMEKYHHELEQIEEKNSHIRKLEKDLNCLVHIKKMTDKRLEKFSIFREYFEKVISNTREEYHDIREIIDRFNTLLEVRESLTERSNATKDLVEVRQQNIEKEKTKKDDDIQTYKEYTIDLSNYKDDLLKEETRLQQSLIRIQKTSADRNVTIGKIKMSTNYLYSQVCKYMRRIPKISHNDTLGQLADIELTVKEMAKLSKDIINMLRAAHLASTVEKRAREKVRKHNEDKQKKLDKFVSNTGKIPIRELFMLPPKPELPEMPEM